MSATCPTCGGKKYRYAIQCRKCQCRDRPSTGLAGKVVSEETRRRMSESARRRCQTSAFRERVEGYWLPFCSEEELRRDYEADMMTQEEIGAKHGVSLKRVQTSMRRYGIKPRKQAKRWSSGENANYWVGDNATYSAFHARVQKARGKPSRCDRCQKDDPAARYEWANLSGDYANVNDYARMCLSCHRKYDAQRRAVTGQPTVNVPKKKAVANDG